MTSDFLRAIDFCEAVIDGTHDSPKQVEDGRKLVTSKNVVGGKLDLENCYNISQEDFEQINKRSKVYQWDILMSMIGTVGEICILKDEPDYAIKNVGVFRAKNESDAKWLYYYLISPNAQFEIYSRLRGSTQKFLPLGELRNFPILKPANEERKSSIINQLFSIDCLISSNDRLNDKVSELISALFRSWFIDFDPVKAKSDGNLPYGMDEETAALFPDSFEDSEIGPIPKGWVVHDLSALTSKITTGLNPRKNFTLGVGDKFYVTTKNISAGRLIIDDSCDFIDADAIQKINKRSRLAKGDILMTGVGTVGQIYMLDSEPVNWNINESVYSLRANHEKISSQILYQILESHEFQYYCKNYALGSVQKGIRKYDIEKFKIAIPPYELMEKISSRLEPMMKVIQKNWRILESLNSTRDALLPRLMSGELGLPVEA